MPDGPVTTFRSPQLPRVNPRHRGHDDDDDDRKDGHDDRSIYRKANHYKDPFTKQRHRNKQTHACLHGCTNTLYRQVIFKKSLSFDIPKIVLARADCAEGAVGQGEDHGWQDCAKPLPRWPDAPPLPQTTQQIAHLCFLDLYIQI